MKEEKDQRLRHEKIFAFFLLQIFHKITLLTIERVGVLLARDKQCTLPLRKNWNFIQFLSLSWSGRSLLGFFLGWVCNYRNYTENYKQAAAEQVSQVSFESESMAKDTSFYHSKVVWFSSLSLTLSSLLNRVSGSRSVVLVFWESRRIAWFGRLKRHQINKQTWETMKISLIRDGWVSIVRDQENSIDTLFWMIHQNLYSACLENNIHFYDSLETLTCLDWFFFAERDITQKKHSKNK